MQKTAIAIALALSMTAPAFATETMTIGDYPKTAKEVEYCIHARFDKDIDLPKGCWTLGERILHAISEELKS